MSKDSTKKSRSAAEIQADLEARRAALADTVDGLTAQLDPRTNLRELKAQLSDTAANASDEAHAFVSRIQQGDRRTQDALGLAATGVIGLLGLVLLRRGRRR